MGCYIWYSEEKIGQGRSPPRPLLAVPNVTAHPSMASVPITVLLYNGPLLCGLNVPIKELMQQDLHAARLIFYLSTNKSTPRAQTPPRPLHCRPLVTEYMLYKMLNLISIAPW